MNAIDILEDFLEKGGPYIGPRGGKWANPEHTIPWKDVEPLVRKERELALKLWNSLPGANGRLLEAIRTQDDPEKYEAAAKLFDRIAQLFAQHLDAKRAMRVAQGKSADPPPRKKPAHFSASLPPKSIKQFDRADAEELADYARSKARYRNQHVPFNGVPPSDEVRQAMADERDRLLNPKKKRQAQTDLFGAPANTPPPGQEQISLFGKSYALDTAIEALEYRLEKAGPYEGPGGEHWADPQHTIPYVAGADGKPSAETVVRVQRQFGAVGHLQIEASRLAGRVLGPHQSASVESAVGVARTSLKKALQDVQGALGAGSDAVPESVAPARAAIERLAKSCQQVGEGKLLSAAQKIGRKLEKIEERWSRSMDESTALEERLEKRLGEGSRGGVVIGHTGAGKPIYQKKYERAVKRGVKAELKEAKAKLAEAKSQAKAAIKTADQAKLLTAVRRLGLFHDSVAHHLDKLASATQSKRHSKNAAAYREAGSRVLAYHKNLAAGSGSGLTWDPDGFKEIGREVRRLSKAVEDLEVLGGLDELDAFLEKSEAPAAEQEQNMDAIEELEALAKAGPHKYTSRKKGPGGKWIYTYDEPGKGGKSRVTGTTGTDTVWEPKGDQIWGGKTTVTYAPLGFSAERKVPLFLRIDAREGTFRVDNHDLLAWSAIDGGDGFKTLDEAKAFVEKWKAAVVEQRSLSPRMTPRASIWDKSQEAAGVLEEYLGKSDDGKPGESLEETDTAELKATAEDLGHRLKKKPGDKAMEGRLQAIQGELARRQPPDFEKARKDLTPEKARQILHDKEVHGRPLTEQQRKYFGAVASGTARKSMENGTEVLEDYLEKAGGANGLPTGEPRLGGEGGEQGGPMPKKAKGDGQASGKPTAGTDERGRSKGLDSGKKEKLSEDDDEDETGKISTAAKPIERATRKSVLPADQRDMTAREQKALEMRLRKGEPDVQVHPFSTASLHGGSDEQAAALAKAQPEPTLRAPVPIALQTVLCKAEGCGHEHSAMLTACPACGGGTVVSRPLPVMVEASPLEKGRGPGSLLRRPRGEQDVVIGGPDVVVPNRSSNTEE